jgi:hypothetical protein
LIEVGCEGLYRIYMAQHKDPVTGSCVYGKELLRSIKHREFIDQRRKDFDACSW